MRKITLLLTIVFTAMLANVSKVSAQTVLGTPTGVNSSLITAVGFTANWTPADANAISFDVKVYDVTSTLIKTVNVTGAATATAAITGLTSSTAYTFTLTAKGNGTTFTNSTESSPVSVSTIAFTTLTTPTVGTATRITLTGFTASWTAVNNATSYDVNVYDASNVLVTGSPKNIIGTTSATLALTGMLIPNTTYTFTVIAKGDNIIYSNSLESTKSTSFTTAIAGSFLLQYADVDVATLNADIKGGAADIYELTTSGGAYTFNTGSTSNNNTMVRSTNIRALSGLARKPIIKVISTTTGSTPNLFYTNTPNMTIRFDGLELSGLNTATSASQLMLFLGGPLATNCSVYLNNCVLHEFLNASGNGIIRLDGLQAAPTGLINIQGCTFYNFNGRALYLNPTTTVNTSVNINLRNNTFYNNSVISTRANIIYNVAAVSTWSGTITIDHCTFNNIVTTSTTEGIIRNLTPATGGSISITNSIFTAVGQTLYSYVSANNCYLAGFGTLPTGATGTPVINTFNAVPAPSYTDITNANIANYNFRLTNTGSFICPDGFVAGNTYNMLAVPNVSAGGNHVSSTGFTANWAAVVNASSYDVRVYNATSAQVGSTVNVPAGTLSLAITGLTANTTYTYTVIAIGDHVTYLDSSVSATSAPVATLVTGINSLENATNIFVSNKVIYCSETGLIQVYNVQGVKVLQADNTNKLITTLESGMYIVYFTGNDGQIKSSKVIIN